MRIGVAARGRPSTSNKDATMSQAEFAPDTNRPDLAQELPVDPEARAETRARAANSVAAFAQSSALAALDDLIAVEDAAAARGIADRATERARLLDAEVARFRALADQNV